MKRNHQIFYHAIDNPNGLALVWIVLTMVMLSAVGAVMVSFYSTTSSDPAALGLASQTRLLAESGRRFFESHYRDAENITGESDEEIAKNKLMADFMHKKTFNPVAGEGHTFELDITSYFCRVETDPNGGTTLRLKFVGSKPDDLSPTALSSGSLRIEDNETIFTFSSAPTTAGTGDDTVYIYSMDSSIPATDVNTGVYFVASRVTPETVNDGGTLTVDVATEAEAEDLFPSENGMFLLEHTKIRDNLPVATTVPYVYEYRSGNQLFNVEKGPKQGQFETIDTDVSANIEVAKSVLVTSTGAFEDQVSSPVNYQLAVPSSSSTKGLKAFWNFDDAGDPFKDDYGTTDGISDPTTDPTLVGTSKVGSGALDFDGTQFLSTNFKPSLALGTNRPFAVAFWANPDPVAGAFSLQVVVGTDTFLVGVLKSGGNFKWFWLYGNQNDLTGIDLPDVVEGQWQHVVFEYDGSDVIFYLNGVKAYTKAYSGSGVLGTLDLTIGARPTLTTPDFNYFGLLDELAIFNTDLGICQVREIFDVPCNVGCGVFNTANDPATHATDPVTPVAYYPANGNADDESGTDKTGHPTDNNDMTVFAAVLTTDRFGCEDKAYEYDGTSDYLTVATTNSLNLSDVDKMTVAAWVKRGHTAGTSEYIAYHVGSYILWLWGGYPSLFVTDGTTGSWYFWRSDTALSDTGWHHIVATFDYSEPVLNDRIKLYLDGVEQGFSQNLTHASSIQAPTSNLYTSINFIGKIDDLSVWERDLSQTEITDYYNLTNPSP